MPSTHNIVTNRTLVDYFRIATFDPIQFYKLTAALERQYTGWYPKKWLQYRGRQSSNGVFHGIGEQGKRPHFLIQVSGQSSHHFFQWLSNYNEGSLTTFYCTRIDLQRTQTRPTKEYRRIAHKRLRGKKSLIDSDTGLTLYIGARTSDTFWRLYDKDDTLLRVEVEIKGTLAKRAWVALRMGEQLPGIWNRFLLKSRVPKVYTDLYRDNGEVADLPLIEEAEDLQPKLQWLQTLDSLIFKLINDHDTSEATKQLVRRWNQYADAVDTKGEGNI